MARSGDGSSQYLKGGDAFLVSLGAFCLSFWIKSHNTSQSNKFVMQFKEVAGMQLSVIYGFVAGDVEMYTNGGGTGDFRTGSGVTLGDTNWHHIAYRKASGSGAYDKFLDGSKTNIGTPTLTTPSAQTELWLLRSVNGDHADVEVEDLAWWEGTLPADADISDMASNLKSAAFYTPTRLYRLPGDANPEPEDNSATGLTVFSATQTSGPGLSYPSGGGVATASLANGGLTHSRLIRGGLAR